MMCCVDVVLEGKEKKAKERVMIVLESEKIGNTSLMKVGKVSERESDLISRETGKLTQSLLIPLFNDGCL